MKKKKLGLLPKILIAIILGIVIGSLSPEWLVASLATFSGLFGNFLGFAIPLIIIGFIAPGIGELGKGAGRLLGVTTGLAYISTVLAGLLAFVAATLLYPHVLEVGGLINSYTNPEEALLEPFSRWRCLPYSAS